nr:ATP-grasp domain-containing protein [Treponema sp.]
MNEKQNTVLILGAGLMQRPAIQFAKKNGFYTVVVDANSKALCVDEADRFEPVDLKDKEGLLSLAKTLDNLVAVFTAGTDFSASVAYVASNLGLNGHEYEACLNASNKIRMRTCFKNSNVPSPEFVQVTKNDIALYDAEKLAAMSFPKVIKTVDNMGARGCRMIRDASEFVVAVEDAVKNSRTGCAILEDYMEGPEFSIDSIVHKGTLTITGFADRHIYYPPYFIETGHTMPTKIDEKQRLELIEAFAKGVKALGLTEGAAKGDIKYTSKGPMIGEIAARLSGGYMSGWTYPYASDVNLTEQALFIACGKEPEALLANRVKLNNIKDSPFELYDLPCKRTCAERAWISIPGIIDSITGYEKAEAIKGIKDLLSRNKEGDEVDFPRNNVQKCGNVIAVGENFEEASNIASSAISSIVLRLKA